MAGSHIISLRLPPDLNYWFQQRVQKKDGAQDPILARKPTPTEFIMELLEAARSGRLLVTAEPVSFINDGSSPEVPVLVCHNPR